MQQLATRTNLIPVIAKADMLTPQELLHFKDVVRTVIRENNIRVFTCAVDDDAVTTSGPNGNTTQDEKASIDAEVIVFFFSHMEVSE